MWKSTTTPGPAAFFFPPPQTQLPSVFPVSTPPSHRKGLRTVALIEASKGVVVLIVGFGVLSFLGRDAEEFAEQIVSRLHLNPAHHYPQIFIRAMADLDNTRLWQIAGFAALYASMRFFEAYGLWHARRWAEWFAALSGGIYVPFELYELGRRPSWLILGALVVNLVIVGYMVWLLTEARRLRAAAGKKLTAPAG
ncbi:MAG: DUF2127 domain-containing protein [Opitutae bacterium]|nr:DUF2127 domain-containing protein [Opitutae bacterium]